MRNQQEYHSFAWTATSLILLALLPVSGFGEETATAGQISAGDTSWLMISTALVIMMTVPGLAMFYGGLVSQRNVLSTFMHSFFAACLISAQWILWGYSFSFGSGFHGIFGGFDHLFFAGVGEEAKGTVPHLAFAMFQCAFAIITFALVTGAVVERLSFKAYFIFALLWATFVYDPLAYWVWGGGWLMKLGILDFAGGTVVEIASGASALMAALIVGKRLGYPKRIQPPHNVPFTIIGASLLWVGWFGFNAGSALAANGVAALAFTTTNTAGSMAGLTWSVIEWNKSGKPTILGAATGVVAGMVAITPAAGFVSVPASITIGVVAGILSYYGIFKVKAHFGYDDSLDVLAVHGICGTWGTLATGIFASKALNSAGADGLLHGNPHQLLVQFYGTVAAWTLAVIGTASILLIIKIFVPLRVTPEEESMGCDMALHDEAGYNFLSSGNKLVTRED